MSEFHRLVFCIWLLLVAVAAVEELDMASVFEDIKIDNFDVKGMRRPAPFIGGGGGGVTFTPTAAPTIETDFPSFVPTFAPTQSPSAEPTFAPTFAPTVTPTFSPTETPTVEPTHQPSAEPTRQPTPTPSAAPTFTPTYEPTYSPSATPTAGPTATPTAAPTFMPTAIPTAMPTFVPTEIPTYQPTRAPTFVPTYTPTVVPSATPVPTAAVNEGVKVEGTTTVDKPASVINANPNNKVAIGAAIDTTLSLPIPTTKVGDAYDATRRLRAVFTQRKLQSGSAIVPFTIELSSTSVIGAPNAESAAAIITDTLNTAITDGTFTTTLNAAAVTYSAPQLVNATFDPVVVIYEPISNDKKDPPVSSGEIAGIVIGCVVGVALIGVALYYYLEYRRMQFADDFKGDSFYQPNQSVYRDLGEPDLTIKGPEAAESRIVLSTGETGRL